jgi:hypothetical protein
MLHAKRLKAYQYRLYPNAEQCELRKNCLENMQCKAEKEQKRS